MQYIYNYKLYIMAYLSISFARLMAFDSECFSDDRRELSVLSLASFLLNFSCIRFTLLGRPAKVFFLYLCFLSFPLLLEAVSIMG